jgi:hypothetical protein
MEKSNGRNTNNFNIGGNMLLQQGDVCIIKVKEIQGKKLKHLTLAKGETTGHHHTITEGDAELYDHEGTLFLRVKSEEATLTHQEHNTITIPKGDYKITIVREYDHFLEESRRVHD